MATAEFKIYLYRVAVGSKDLEKTIIKFTMVEVIVAAQDSRGIKSK